MMEILKMTKEELLSLDSRLIDWQLSAEEIVHIAIAIGAYWQYDYEAAERGKRGMHAILKSEQHSDGFFVSKILLEPPNIRALIAQQMVMRFNQLGIPKPNMVIGIPDGATKLAENVGAIMGVKVADVKKEDGKIVLKSLVQSEERLLMIEDFCTRGTGFKEAVLDILSKQPGAKVLPYELVILNRGGLESIALESLPDPFKIVAVIEYRVNDWDPKVKCPLCDMGSIPIKPKAAEENWRLITSSQK